MNETDYLSKIVAVSALKEIVENQRTLIAYWKGEAARLKEALREIAKGEGAFSTDRLTHAQNCIENMIDIATDALKEGAK